VLRPFHLHAVESVAEATSLLRELGDSCKAYCGGTELLLVMKAGFLRYDHLLDLKTIPGLSGVRYDAAGRRLLVGAVTTHHELERSPLVAQHLPIVAEMERLVANVRVRSQGTIGGNLCFGEPHSDPATLFLALEAELVASDGSQDRVLTMEEFIVDAYTTGLRDDEILTEIRLPLLPARAGAAYQKFGIHERPTLGVAVAIFLDEGHAVAEARIAVGCVGPTPARLREAEAVLQGAGPDDFAARLAEAASTAAALVDPIDDLHGSAEYKRHLVGVFIRRVATQAHARAEG
jgi:carbon-monoxide dehydrogenase medium subunit